jgi:molybdopterin-synthase adenylyltransferase
MKGMERYVRQTVFSGLGVDGQKRLLRSRVLLVGCGALGSAISVSLVRSGVGQITMVDQDFPELINLHRQFLYDEDNVTNKIPKAVVAAQKLGRANSQVKIIPVVTELSANNIEKLARSADLILDGTDNMPARYVINDYCVKHKLPWIYGGIVGASGMMMVIKPGETPCLRCLFPQPPKPGTIPTCAQAGVLNPAPMLIGALESIEAIKYLSGKGKTRAGLLQFDLWGEHLHILKVNRNPSCPACGRKNFEFLEKKQTAYTGRTCGENAIKVVPPKDLKLDLAALQKELGKSGKTRFNGYVLEADVRGRNLVVFADGRAIISGVKDEKKAIAVYRKYLVPKGG